MIRILIADDHPLVRAGLKNVLKEETDMSVVAEASNAQELLDLVKRENMDVVLLDIHDTAGLVRYAIEQGLLSISARV